MHVPRRSSNPCFRWRAVVPCSARGHVMTTPHSWANLVSRRDLLRVASLGIAGTLLPRLSPASQSQLQASAKSVIVLWMAGGVTHLDSFDPKPDAPREIKGSLGVVKTT